MLYKLIDLQPNQILPPNTIPVGPHQAMVPYVSTFNLEELQKSIDLVEGGSYIHKGPAHKRVIQAARALYDILKAENIDIGV